MAINPPALFPKGDRIIVTPEPDIPAVVALHDRFGLTAKEALVVLLLARSRGIVEPIRIRDVYADSPRTPPIEARSAIKRIRKKVGEAVKIKSHYGMGYALEAESSTFVRNIMKAVSQ